MSSFCLILNISICFGGFFFALLRLKHLDGFEKGLVWTGRLGKLGHLEKDLDECLAPGVDLETSCYPFSSWPYYTGSAGEL